MIVSDHAVCECTWRAMLLALVRDVLCIWVWGTYRAASADDVFCYKWATCRAISERECECECECECERECECELSVSMSVSVSVSVSVGYKDH